MINLNKVTWCVVRGILRHGQRYLPVKLRIPPPNSLLSLHVHHSRPPYTYPPRYLYILVYTYPPIPMYTYSYTPIQVDRLEDELVGEQEKLKGITEELEQTFAEMSGY